MEALKTQIGGNHYKSMKIQPIELISKLNLNYFQGNIVKYISRDKENKIEDLKKAKHYCELAIELDKVNKLKNIICQNPRHKKVIKEIIRYRRENLFDEAIGIICFAIYRKDYKEVIKKIEQYAIHK